MKKEVVERSASQERFELLGVDREARREVGEVFWEEKLETAAKSFGVSLTALPPRRLAPTKVQLAALLKANTSVSNGWLAERLEMDQPASVSQYVRRFRLSGDQGKRWFQQALSRVKP